MNGSEQLTAFLARVRSDTELQQQLVAFRVEQWGDAHLPLDIDLDAVIALASDIGFHFDRADVVARRYMARIQLQVDRGGEPEAPISYYRP